MHFTYSSNLANMKRINELRRRKTTDEFTIFDNNGAILSPSVYDFDPEILRMDDLASQISFVSCRKRGPLVSETPVKDFNVKINKKNMQIGEKL